MSAAVAEQQLRCPSCGGAAALEGPDWRGDRWVECRSYAACDPRAVDRGLRLALRDGRLARRECDALLHPPLPRPAS